jgi:hypothetical protein
MSCLIPNTISRVAIEEGARTDIYRKIHPNRSYEVAKVGRTTGWTTGKINAIGSYLNLRKDSASALRTEFKQLFADVVLAIGILSNHDLYEFLEGSDSGSVVLLNEPGVQASVVGLGFAANDSTMVSYMTPMSLVVRDIAKITGCEIVEPVEAEDAQGASPR